MNNESKISKKVLKVFKSREIVRNNVFRNIKYIKVIAIPNEKFICFRVDKTIEKVRITFKILKIILLKL